MNKLIAIAFLAMILMSTFAASPPTRRKYSHPILTLVNLGERFNDFGIEYTKSGEVDPIDFHAPFKYTSCKGAIFDLINQFLLLYGDIYATTGLNTALFRVYQVAAIKFKAFADICF